MVEQIRAKWCEDLEELLQCPVCFERPVNSVLQCNRGHHICVNCKQQVCECPICKCEFSTARNYIAEKLSSMLDNIKLSLLDPEHSINKCKKVTAVAEANAKNNKHLPTPMAAKGVFPCRIGSCDLKLPHGRMLPHLRYFHKNQLYETKTPTGNSYTQIWELEYRVNTNFEVAIHIPKMCVFFVNIRITDKGAFTGIVQILNTNCIGKDFTYELKLDGSQRSSSFKSNPGSCRTNPVNVFDAYNCLFIHQFDMRRFISSTQSVTCTLTITHESESSDNELLQNGSATTRQVCAF